MLECLEGSEDCLDEGGAGETAVCPCRCNKNSSEFVNFLPQYSLPCTQLQVRACGGDEGGGLIDWLRREEASPDESISGLKGGRQNDEEGRPPG